MVERTSPHIDSIEACQSPGSNPPTVDPTMEPIQMRRLLLTS